MGDVGERHPRYVNTGFEVCPMIFRSLGRGVGF